jgi:hypothetical protein
VNQSKSLHIAKKRQNANLTADLLRQYLASTDLSVHALHVLTGTRHSSLRKLIISLPAEFGLYNVNGKAFVKYFQGSAGTQVRIRQWL